MKKKFKQISLFSGIGGFDIASEWAGWETAAWCEWETYCQEILKYYWPHAKQFSDIKKSDFKEFENQIHVITGGFPCQPYSSAGKRLGKQDERHLWPEMCRVINEVKPNWIVGENVRGLLNWNEGIVFDEVCVDLENSGYDPIVFMIPAVAVGAPHRRDRVWFVAKRKDYTGSSDIDSYSFNDNGDFPRINWNNFPSHNPVIESTKVSSNDLNISFPKWRNGSIKAYGNAIVPQVVYELFKVMNKYESVLPNNNDWKSWFLNELISSDSWTRRYPVQWSQKVLMNRGYNSLAVNTKRKVQNADDSSDLFLGTPRVYERPRSEKFSRNAVPTPSEFILSKDKMESLKHLSTEWGLLPTPTANDMKNTTLPESQRNQDGGLIKMILNYTLPAPTTSDYKGARKQETLKESGRNQTNGLCDAFSQPGKSSQLNPEFVGEMMGFPPYWTFIPYIKQEQL